MAKLPVTPPSGQNNGTFVDFVYEKGDGCRKREFFLTSKQQQFQKLVDCTEQHFLGSLTYFGNGVLQFNMLFRALLSCLVANFDTFCFS